MSDAPRDWRPRSWLALALLVSTALQGCGWLNRFKTPEGDEAFPAWSQSMGSSVRGSNKQDGKPSGLLFDKRSQEIEKNLGGNF